MANHSQWDPDPEEAYDNPWLDPAAPPPPRRWWLPDDAPEEERQSPPRGGPQGDGHASAPPVNSVNSVNSPAPREEPREAVPDPTAIWSAPDLLARRFSPPRWAVETLLAQGLTLLCGAPKLGKSWLCLQCGIAVAAGGRALGQLSVERGAVLYAALEDTPRRLQGRLRKLLAGERAPADLAFLTLLPRISEGGLETLRGWLTEHPNARLVMIDTLARVRPLQRSQGNAYGEDYHVIAALKALADAHDVSILVVHHTRKMTAEDRQEMVSGTNGLAGAADTALVLVREANGPVLYGRGRDIEELDLSLAFDRATCCWNIKGSAEEQRISIERQEIMELIAGSDGGLMPIEIARALDKNRATIRSLCAKMLQDGLLARGAAGRYTLAEGNAQS